MTTLLDGLAQLGQSGEIEVGPRHVKLTNLDKVLWPRTGTTKRQMLTYYARVAPALLRHIRGRPLTLARFPDGVEGTNWYQTSCPHPPPWLRTHPVHSTDGSRIVRDHCIVDDLAGLVWVVNLGAIELHPLLSLAETADTPSVIVFDLDPGEVTTFSVCCRVALLLRGLLAQEGLVSFPKTSGATGIHVYVPLNSPHKYSQTKTFAKDVARRLAAEHPNLIADRKEMAHRAGKVLIDWSQNAPSKSLAAPYSLRAMPWPSPSVPVSWDEVERCAESAARLVFDADDAIARLDDLGDLFAPVADLQQRLPSTS